MKRAAIALGVVIFVAVLGFCIKSKMTKPSIAQTRVIAAAVAEPAKPVYKYGLNLSDFKVLKGVVKQHQFFAEMLAPYNVTYQTADFLARASKEVFNLKKIKAGNPYTVLCEKNSDSVLVPKKLIYEESKVAYVVFNLEDSLYIYRGQNKVVREHREVAGIINSSLYETLESNNMNPALAVRLSEIFAWTIDFYKLQKGDKFKVMYDEDYVNGEAVGMEIGRAHV